MDTSQPNPKAEQPSCGGPADQICDKQNVEEPRYSSQDCTKSKTKLKVFLVNDIDRDILHQLGMFLYTHGIKPSDSLILRAAIRSVPRGHRFIKEVMALQTKDGRKIRHRQGKLAALGEEYLLLQCLRDKYAGAQGLKKTAYTILSELKAADVPNAVKSILLKHYTINGCLRKLAASPSSGVAPCRLYGGTRGWSLTFLA
jgi:hypothetical protein